MKFISIFLILLAFLRLESILIKQNRRLRERKLSLRNLNQNLNQRNPERKLTGSALTRNDMDMIYRDTRSANGQKMIASDMKNQAKINNIQTQLHQIASDMESINDSMISKLKIFEDAVDRIKLKRRQKRKLYRLPNANA